MVSPMAPHIGEGSGGGSGHDRTLAFENVPGRRARYLADDTLTCVVQIPQQVRDRVDVPADIAEGRTAGVGAGAAQGDRATAGIRASSSGCRARQYRSGVVSSTSSTGAANPRITVVHRIRAGMAGPGRGAARCLTWGHVPRRTETADRRRGPVGWRSRCFPAGEQTSSSWLRTSGRAWSASRTVYRDSPPGTASGDPRWDECAPSVSVASDGTAEATATMVTVGGTRGTRRLGGTEGRAGRHTPGIGRPSGWVTVPARFRAGRVGVVHRRSSRSSPWFWRSSRCSGCGCCWLIRRAGRWPQQLRLSGTRIPQDQDPATGDSARHAGPASAFTWILGGGAAAHGRPPTVAWSTSSGRCGIRSRRGFAAGSQVVDAIRGGAGAPAAGRTSRPSISPDGSSMAKPVVVPKARSVVCACQWVECECDGNARRRHWWHPFWSTSTPRT